MVRIPFGDREQLYYRRKWLLKHEGQKLVSLTLPKSFIQGWAATWFDVWIQACEINLFESLKTINCPVYFFSGKKAYNTNYIITQEYFNKVAAPKKDSFLFADAGHGLPEKDPDSFQEVIIENILPATF